MAALEAQREATRTTLGVTEPVAVPPAAAPPVVAPVVSDPAWAVPSRGRSRRRPSRATRSTRPTPEPIVGCPATAERAIAPTPWRVRGATVPVGRALELEQELVRVAPVPVLAGLVRADDRMAARPLVRRGVAHPASCHSTPRDHRPGTPAGAPSCGGQRRGSPRSPARTA